MGEVVTIKYCMKLKDYEPEGLVAKIMRGNKCAAYLPSRQKESVQEFAERIWAYRKKVLSDAD